MSRRIAVLAAAAGLTLAASGLSGCAACPGVKSAPAKPTPVVAAAPARAVPTGPYSIEITPANDVNPVRTQHVLVATVRDTNGTPVPGANVEWILARAPKAVGDIVDVDGGKKIDNTYAKSTTARGDTVLDWGTEDKADDVKIGAGQTWCVITSAVEGATSVVAYSPDIKDWNRHKAFAEKNWMDVTWEWPADATNRIGQPHTFAVKMMRYSDGTPHQGWLVHWKILSGPAGTLSTGGQMGTVTTGADGVATVTLTQEQPAVGTNEVEITVVRPARKDECECWPEKQILNGVVRKHWVASDVAIAKSAPATAVVGDSFEYSIVVTNPIADLEVRDVVVTDPLPEGIDYVSSTPAATVNGRTLTWNLGNIPGGGSQNLTVVVKATRRSNAGEFRNCAQVTAEQGRLTRDACATTVVTAPALKVEKYGPAEVLLCDPIPYRIVVRNAGDATTKNVRLVDALPEGLTTAAGETRVEFPAFDLGPGESREFTVDAKAGKTGSFTNTASATADGNLTDSASASTKVKNCALTLTKKAKRADLITGRPATFDLTVANTGDADAKDVVLEDVLPAGTAFVSATDGGVLNGTMVVWNLGTMAPGATKTVSLTITANDAGGYRNTATVRAYCCPEATASDEVVYKGIPAVLLELVDSPDPIEVGGQTTYTIDVTNQGFADDMDIEIVCTLPAEQKFVSADTTLAQGVTFTQNGQVIRFAKVPVLAPKARITYKIVVEATGVGDVRFAVEMNTRELKSPVNETEATRQY